MAPKFSNSLVTLEIHLPSPENHYSNDICIDKDTTIVATSKGEITFREI